METKKVSTQENEKKLSLMTSKADKNGQNLDTTLLKFITALLCDVKIEEKLELEQTIAENEDFQKLYSVVTDIRNLSASLSKGDLSKLAYTNRGYVISNLKALHAHLRHLTWQTKKIAEGDFSQSVDFLGEFSEAFNKMKSKLKESNEQLLNLATLDHLTLIPNRHSMIQFLSKIFHTQRDFCIFMIDIDHFKSVNDTYGHDIGDETLIYVSSVLNEQLRGSDFISRYGGEEFLIVLPDTSLEIAKKVAARLLRAINHQPLNISNTESFALTISIGLSQKLETDKSYEEVVKRSDKALYRAKKTGRNKCCVYGEDESDLTN